MHKNESIYNFVKKSLTVLFGMFLLGIGINFLLIANIGTDAVTAAVIGIYNLIGTVTFGTAQIIFGIIFVGTGFLLNRHKVGVGTVIATFAAGYFIDLFKPYITQLVPANPTLQISIALVLVGLMINGIAIAIYLSADFGIGGGEILAVILSEKMNWQFRYVKIGSDIIMLLFGFFCGAVIGVGTVLSALMIGPVVQAVLPFAKKFLNSDKTIA